MHRKYQTNLCRLCLGKNVELIDIFKENEIYDLTVAQVISELFHVVVSADDIYPRAICKECRTKLKRFYGIKSNFPVETLPSFLLFRNQCHIVTSTIDYAKTYNVETPDCQHSPVSWDHSPLSLELEALAADEELRTRRVAVDNLLESVAHILRSIRGGGLWKEREDALEEAHVGQEGSCGGAGKAINSSSGVTEVQLDDRGKKDGPGLTPLTPSVEVQRGIKRTHSVRCEEVGKNHSPAQSTVATIKAEEESRAESGDDLEQTIRCGPSRVKMKGKGNGGEHQGELRCEGNRYQCLACLKWFPERETVERHIEKHHCLIGAKIVSSLPQSQGKGKSPNLTKAGKSKESNVPTDPSSDRDDEFLSERDGDEIDDGSKASSSGDAGSCYECALCNIDYTSIKDLRNHLMSVHLRKKEREDAGTVRNGPQPKGKRVRKAKTKTEDMWYKFAVSVDGEDGWVRCCTCGGRFTCLTELKEHIMNPLTQDCKGVQRNTGKQYFCCRCPQIFESLVFLERHVKTQHSDQRPYSCDECGATFKLEKYLKKHAKLHSGVRPFKCAVCAKAFRNRSELELHSTVHVTELKFECGDCGKKFRAKHLLKIHLRNHNLARIQCPECPTKFTQMSDLRKHMAVHSGVRNFECSECKKRFRHKRNLNDHMRLHNRIKVALYS
ncbi:zinc finger protein 497-like [Hetaerina americana]|uniref:zinc finger protein 497-like n=1 Tax=Hetaerina americana TaxID=62018 RepID=UPI003A7F4989